MRGKDWSVQELEYLQEHWGEKTIPQIARNLGRSFNAVSIKAKRLGLGSMLSSSEYMTATLGCCQRMPGKRDRLR
jgi:hypothetical protein